MDNLQSADVVTADGERRRASDSENADLFWAIRGGGGNFGVATRFQFRLHELPSMVGGMLILPATVETVAGFVAACEAAPNELSAIGNVMPCPPMPFVPEEHHGDLGELLDRLGAEGVVQVLVEGGAAVAHGFHAAGLVDRYVVYVAPVLFGGDDARGVFAGPGAPSIGAAWRGRIASVTRLGADLRIDVLPGAHETSVTTD